MCVCVMSAIWISALSRNYEIHSLLMVYTEPRQYDSPSVGLPSHPNLDALFPHFTRRHSICALLAIFLNNV